jgi:hypothetical protein
MLPYRPGHRDHRPPEQPHERLGVGTEDVSRISAQDDQHHRRGRRQNYRVETGASESKIQRVMTSGMFGTARACEIGQTDGAFACFMGLFALAYDLLLPALLVSSAWVGGARHAATPP